MSDRRFTILVTGPLSPTDEVLPTAAENIIVDIVPFIRTSPRISDSLTNKIHTLMHQPLNAVFTSGEAVRVVRSTGGKPCSWTCYSTSGTTEKLLREWLGDDSTLHSAKDAAGLAEELIRAGIKEAVFFCGSQRRDLLPARLRAAGIRLEEITVYETIATPVKLDRRYDAVLFFSPSAVNSFLSLNNLSATTTVFALGNTTAEELKKRSAVSAVISEHPGKILLLKMALEYAHANQIL